MSSSSQTPSKKNKGRQKIKMEKIENATNLQVTFSKRRAGLFKKAYELCIMCDVEVLLVVFSPTRKAYSYGHPDVESVANKFLNGDTRNLDSTDVRLNRRILEATRNSKIRYRNLELTHLNHVLAMEKQKSKELKYLKKQGQIEGLIAPSLEKFSLEQLIFFEKTITNCEKHFNENVAKFMSHNPNPLSNLNATSVMKVSNNVGSRDFVPNNNPSFSHVLDNVATGFNIGIYNKVGAIDTGEVPLQSEWINNWATSFSKPGDLSTYETKIVDNTFPGLSECNSWTPGFGVTGAYASGGTSVANNFVAPDPYDPMSPVQNDFFMPSYDLNFLNGVANPYGLITANPGDAMYYRGSRSGMYYASNDDNVSSLY